MVAFSLVSMQSEWFVAHTKPRCEKKLAEYCQRQGLPHTLPCYRNVRKYRGKTVTFHKPLFPGYVFLHLSAAQRQKAFQSDYVASLLEVADQATFAQQLNDILVALEQDLEIRLAPEIGAGRRVTITSGPLRGMEGWVERRHGATTVLLRLDFIGKAAAVTVEADQMQVV